MTDAGVSGRRAPAASAVGEGASAEPGSDAGPSGPVIAVVGADPEVDPGVLTLASAYAGARSAALTALAALDAPTDLRALARATGTAPDALLARLVDDARDRLRAGVAQARPDVPIDLDVRIGKGFLEIIRAVHTTGAQLIVKRADPFPSGRGPLFGSTDQHLLRKCPCPVWLIRGDAAPPRRLLVAVDVDALTAEQPETQAALNLRIVDAAARLADLSGAELHLLHVWDAPGEGLLWRWSTGEGQVTRYLLEADAEHGAALGEFRELARAHLDRLGLGHVALATRLRRGLPRDVIPREIEALGADTLVMGTIARTGVAGFIIGNTAEDVLNSVDCSVVTVKPPGYVSPVR